MPSSRQRGSFAGQSGWSLVELLIVMFLMNVILAVIVQCLVQSSNDTQDIERRSVALDDAQVGLDKMTKDLRQATWLYFRSSSVVDLNVKVRASSVAAGTYALVRYDCSSDTCTRSVGTATTYPPPSAPTFTKTEDIIGEPGTYRIGRDGQVYNHDVFTPQRIDPTTGVRSTSFVLPDYVGIRLQIADWKHTEGSVELSEGVTLRNRTTFAG